MKILKYISISLFGLCLSSLAFSLSAQTEKQVAQTKYYTSYFVPEDSFKTQSRYKYDDQCRQTERIDAYWDEDVWTDFKKENYTYFQGEALATRLEQFYDTDIQAWTDYRKTTFTYDDGNQLISETTEINDFGDWYAEESKTFVYDGEQLKSSQHQMYDYGDIMENHTVQYNDAGEILEEVNEYYDFEGEINDGTKYTYEYNAENVLLILTTHLWDINTQAWQNSVQMVRSIFSGTLPKEETLKKWNGNMYENVSRTLYSYDTELNLTERIEADWLGGMFTDKLKITYAYDGNNYKSTETTAIYTNGNFWRDSHRYLYEHTGQGLMTLKQYDIWDDSGFNPQWVPQWQEVLDYNGDDLKISEIHNEYSIGKWEPISKKTYDYSPAGNFVLNQQELFQNGNWVNDEKETYSYDAEENILTWTWQDWESGKTVGFLHENYQYSNCKIITDIVEKIHPFTVKVYPNPFSQQFKIQFELQKTESITFNLMDITGKTVFQMNETISAGMQVIEINKELPTGVYVYEISTGTNRLTGKLICQ